MSSKAEGMMRKLKEQLGFRLPSTLTLTDGLDSSGNPTLQIGAVGWVTMDQFATVRIQPVALVFTDGLGGTQQGFSTHYVDVAVECITTSPKSSSALSLSIIAPLVQSIEAQAGVTRWYLSNVTVTPTTAQMTAGNLLSTDTPDVIWRMNAAQ